MRACVVVKSSDCGERKNGRDMKRQIRWTERLPDRLKRDVRVTVHGTTIKWQFKRSNMDEWDYDTPPSEEEWDRLEEELIRRAKRGHIERNRDLELARIQRKKR